MNHPIRIFLIVFVCAISNRDAINAAPRFAVMLSNGQRLEGERLHNWHEPDKRPQVDNHKILEPGNPMLWLRDRSLEPGPLPQAYIETIGGDRLPGAVVGYESGSQTFQAMPAHLLVRPSVDVSPPHGEPHEHIRVDTRSLAKVVWQQKLAAEDLHPGTLFFRDGRRQTFRALRFRNDSVQLLLPGGRETVSYRKIAELHLPQSDPWQEYYRELATLSPDGETRLLQIDTIDGLVATGSLSRFQVTTHGNAGDSARWWHAVQPAWSLDTLWVNSEQIWVRRSWSPHEVPLSRFRPTVATSRGLLGEAGWPWRINRNDQGGLIASGEASHGGGFGVHAASELTFNLPPEATAFRTWAAIDRTSGDGGCVIARVFGGTSTRRQLYQSQHLVGSKAIADTNWLNVANLPESERQIVLAVDPAHQGRPAKADPLTLRDDLNWCDPLVRLDPTKLAAQVVQHLPQRMPAFDGWEFTPATETKVIWGDQFEELHKPKPGHFVPTITLKEGPLKLRRKLKVRSRDQWLIVTTYRRNGEDPKPEISVSIDGIVVTETRMAQRGGRDLPKPITIALSPYQGREIDIEITQMPTPNDHLAPIHWYSAKIANQLPMLWRLFEDMDENIDWNNAEQPKVQLVTEPTYSGEHSLRIEQGQAVRFRFEQPLPIRAGPQWNQFRFLRFASKKIGGGTIEVEFETQAVRPNPPVYVVGKPLEEAPQGEPGRQHVNLWEAGLPEEWIVTTRDTYNDFGEIELTGFTLRVPDGKFAVIDHIYLARDGSAFDQLPQVPSAELTNQNARRELARKLLEKGHPATVALHIDERQATGVLIGGDGYLVTAGHVLGKSGRDFEVQLPTGQRLPAKTLGIDRGSDIGLAQITDRQGHTLHGLWLSDQSDLPTNQLYVGFTYAPFVEEIPAAAAHIVGIRQSFRDVVWTDFQLTEASVGGPLLADDGRIVGIHSSTSTLGGFHYAKAAVARKEWERLKKGEVWGDWFPGTGPMLGLIITSTDAGSKVTQLNDDSPASDAGFAVGDLITKLDGQVVQSLQDIYRHLATKNPGDEVTAELSRQGNTQTKKVKLMPRMP